MQNLTQMTSLGRTTMVMELDTFRIENGANGSVWLGLVAGDGNDSPRWELFWELGADWQIFEDGAEMEEEQLDGWEPEAVRSSIRSAQEHLPAVCNACDGLDVDWYLSWADAAESVLS